MPVDQDDLLIFKKRPEKPQKEKKAVEQKQVEQQKPAETPPPEKAKAQPPAPVAPQPPVYQEPEPVIQQQPPTPAPAPPAGYTEPEPPILTLNSDEIPYRPPKTVEIPEPESKAKYSSRKAKIKQMKELAATMNCELHPWRKAYAICDYCKRAFCYEDIVEEAGTFYCVDDMDKIPASAKTVKVVSYGRISTLSVLCFIAILPVYLVLEYKQLAFFISDLLAAQITSVPIYKVFLANPGFSAGILMAVLSFIAGGLVLFGSRSGTRYATIIGVGSGIVFVYIYAVTLIIYPAIYAVIAFFAVLLLLYSRSYYEAAAMQAETVGIPVMDTHPSF
jgi:hypothetical protein